MKPAVDRTAMVRLFEEIREAFPRLTMQLDQNPPQVDLAVDIRRQPGLAFDVHLNLQGDELHLSAGAFWLEWFPCTRPDVVQAYREAVGGLLDGTFRILEHYRGRRAFKAELQKPGEGAWQTIGTWYGWSWPFSRRTAVKILHNVKVQP